MIGNKYFDRLPLDGVTFKGNLQWHQYAGIGYLPLIETPYDEAYFNKYVEMAKTDMGEELTWARLQLVSKWYPHGSLVDVGIGSGQFMDAVGCYGFDINPTAVDLLNETKRYLDPHIEDVDCATFWDSLEHIREIEQILFHVKQYCFVSIPIFRNVDHVLVSRHFRPDEHTWYFTDEGFKKFMIAHGFEVVEQNTMETELGRQDISTYVCKRIN